MNLRPFSQTCAAALFALFSLTTNALGQISDDFSDGDFTQNPAWQGDAAHFKINTAGRLQLNAPSGGTSTLAVPVSVPDSAVWECFFQLDFAPSNANRLRIYLMADGANLSQSNGYYIGIGEDGTADALRLFRQTGGTSTLLASGTAGAAATNPSGKLRVERSAAGAWTVSFAASTDGIFKPQLTATDATFQPGSGQFFGFFCQYTDTRKDKFQFDDVALREDLPDLTAPKIQKLTVADAQTIDLIFDERLEPATAEDTDNYLISNGIGRPTSAVFDQISGNAVRLKLAANLQPNVPYTLTIAGVADLAGNEIAGLTENFEYIVQAEPGEFDIQITEIMADPTPSAGLPEAEWLEILNRSATEKFDLSKLRLADDGGAAQPLPSAELAPNQRLVLCSPTSANLLTGLPGLLPMPNFPSLNNDADVLTLTTADGKLLDRVAYSAAWHDATKRDGGWSLEKINLMQPCLGSENWRSCAKQPGGTPGAANSVENLATTDTLQPLALSAFPLSDRSIRLVFNKFLQTAAANAGNFSLSPPRTVSAVDFQNSDRSQVILTLAEPLEMGIRYTVLLGTDVRDCGGTSAQIAQPLVVALPEKPDFQDVVVNEVLFNPAPNGARFVEFFNRSQRFFSLPDFFIGNFSGTGQVVKVGVERLFAPGEHLVFSENTGAVADQYWLEKPQDLLGNDLPSLADDAGNLTLIWAKNGQTVTVDSFDFSEALHNPLLPPAEREGVSLERIRPDGPTNSAANWTSAAPKPGKLSGSPTARNSQFQAPTPPDADEFIQLISSRLSPDGDGREDFLEIGYTLPKPGFAATMTVFDGEGVAVKRLVRQELLGTAGTLRWDGDTDDGAVARPGIYALFFEIYGPDGAVRRLKRAVAVVW